MDYCFVGAHVGLRGPSDERRRDTGRRLGLGGQLNPKISNMLTRDYCVSLGAGVS